MNKQLLAGFSGLAMAATALATDPAYINNNTVQAPPDDVPMIDASNFVNNSVFIIDEALSSGDDAPYATKNTRYYTNTGSLYSSTGFRFDLHTNADYTSSPSQYATNAEVVYNDAGAFINAGGTNVTGFYSYYFNNIIGLTTLGLGPKLQAWANTIVNKGTIEIGENGLMSLRGKNLDLSGGRVFMEGFGAQLDGYWGIGGQRPFPGTYFTPYYATVPTHAVTNRYYTPTSGNVFMVNGVPYENRIRVNASNFLNQVVYLQSPLDSSISNNVYFNGHYIVVEWLFSTTNIVSGQVSQESVVFEDNFLDINGGPLSLRANGTAAPNTGYGNSYIPTNMYVYHYQDYLPYYGVPEQPNPTLVTFPTINISNSLYKAYEAWFLPTSDPIGEGAGQTYTNARGRIELTASQNLDLSGSRLSSLNALIIKATNNYTADRRTRLLTYAGDFDLGTTNSFMTVTNLMAPTCPRLTGLIDAYSTDWTTVDNTGVTNEYHVLVLDSSSLVHSASTVVQNISLHSPKQVIISDVLNILSNITVDAQSLTISSNGPSALAPYGAINLLSGSILWPTAFPRLHNLTNWGYIHVGNAAYFGAQTNYYANFVNHGMVSDVGSTYIYSDNVENYGSIDAGNSLLNIQADTLTLGRSSLSALNQDISLSVNSLLVTNSTITAGRKLSILANRTLDDGGPTASNLWSVGAGGVWLNTWSNSTYASLLGTTISNSLPTWGTATSQWPGKDRGRSADGYVNNAALGKLVLNGGDPDSLFVFQGAAGAGNALYVDCLELRGSAAALDGTGSLANLTIQPGMKIYYAMANYVDTNGVVTPLTEELNGVNNGALNWVPSYAGLYSSVTVTNPMDGAVYTMNAALRYSTDFNSRKSSPYVVNANLAFPLFVPSEYNFTAQPTNTPAPGILLSWQTIGYATNSVYYKTDLQATNWLMLTNFVSPAVYGPPFTVHTLDRATSQNRMYRIRVDAQLP